MDDYKTVNPILRKIMEQVFRNRQELPSDILTHVRTEIVNNKFLCEVWFMTKGCSHDAKGGCTMCNYGKGCMVNEEKVLEELRQKLSNIPAELEELIVTPTGSMLDDEEVPTSMRQAIYDLLKNTECEHFYVETRVDSISEEKLKSLRESVTARYIHVEVGVECANDWILRNFVNKNMTMQALRKSIQMIHEAGMLVCGNVGIGIPFLNERTSLVLAISSTRKLLDMGMDNVVLFPYHVKPGTLSCVLWEQGLYECCSLWGIPEVLKHFNGEELKKIHISWYRNYYTDKKKILSSPSVAKEDMEEFLMLLDDYKNHPGSETLNALMDYSSPDRNEWREKRKDESENINLKRVKEIFDILCRKFEITYEEMSREWNSMMQSWEETQSCLL